MIQEVPLAPDVETDAPQVLTAKGRDISVTERNSFKTCRRRWYLDTIENLEPLGSITWYYEFGTGLHTGLEAFYKTYGDLLPGDPLDQALFAFEEWYEEMDEQIKKSGNPPGQTAQQREELWEFHELGVGMLTNYNEFAVLNDTFTVCAVEGVWTEDGKRLLNEDDFDPPYGEHVQVRRHPGGRFMVPIVDPESKLWIPGRPYLSARLDMIIYMNQSGLKGFWPMDHKSSASSPSDRGLDMDDQITGYDYTFWRWTGIVPRGTFFNYLIKQLPKEPRFVQANKGNPSGLSTAKDQLTIPEAYREAMVEHDLITPDGKVLSPKHAECYEALLNSGWGRFFKRIPIPRNTYELDGFERRLIFEYEDITDVISRPQDKAYPHLSQYNCPGCAMMPICQAMEDGSDFADVIEHRFQVAKDRKA